MSFLYGLILGFLSGAAVTFKLMKNHTTKHYHITMDAKEATDFVDSQIEVEKLKTELKIK